MDSREHRTYDEHSAAGLTGGRLAVLYAGTTLSKAEISQLKKPKALQFPARCLLPFLALCLTILIVAENAPAAEKRRIPSFEIVRYGFKQDSLSEVSNNDAKVAFEVWGTKLAQKFNYQMEIKASIYETLPALLSAVKGKNCDILGLSSLDYLKLSKTVKLDPFYVVIRGNDVLEKYVLVTNRKNNHRSLATLKGKKLNIVRDSMGDLSIVWVDTILMEKGLPQSSSFFASVTKMEKSNKALLAVYFGEADACIITRNSYAISAELNPNLERNLSVLAESKGLLGGLTCFMAHCNREIKDAMNETFMNIHKEPEGAQILTLFRVTQLSPFKPEYIRSVEELVAKNQSLRNDRVKR
jgi:ABC-type phosphate/phosphonate transport system substrate-binding protein